MTQIKERSLLLTVLAYKKQLFMRMTRFFWGDLTTTEFKKFGILSATYFIIIGVYQMMHALKDPLFRELVGYRWQPFAKLASLLFIAVVVIGYSMLVDRLRKHRLFYFVCLFFGVGLIGIAAAIAYPSICPWSDIAVAGRIIVPGRLIGWISYLFLEAYGSIAAVMFWSFVASTTTAESAKRGYGVILSSTQLGAICGPLVVTLLYRSVSLPVMYAAGGAIICCVPFLIALYNRVIPQEHEIGMTATGSKVGVWEGLRLLLTHPYLAAVFVVSASYEVVATMAEYQVGFCASQVFPASADYAWFMGTLGTTQGILSFVISLFGTSLLLRFLGLRVCLVMFPLLVGVLAIVLGGAYAIGVGVVGVMWLSFVAVIMFRSYQYTINNPSKELLYIPTSKNIKFKTKSWIDAVGNRSLKGVGAVVTGAYGSTLAMLMPIATGLSLGIAFAWLIAAIYVSGYFARLQKQSEIID